MFIQPFDEYDDSIEINSLLLNNDFDDIDKEITNSQINAINQSDEDEEMANKFGY